MVVGLCIYVCDKITCGICCCATEQACKLSQVKAITILFIVIGFLSTYLLFLIGHHTDNDNLIKISYATFGISVILMLLLLYFWLLSKSCCNAEFWLKKCCCINVSNEVEVENGNGNENEDCEENKEIEMNVLNEPQEPNIEDEFEIVIEK